MATEPTPTRAAPRPGTVDRLLGTFATVSVWIAAVFIVAMAVMVTVTVLSRFFLGQPLTALFEFSEYAILAITMLAVPLLLRHDEHVKMDLITEFLGEGHPLVRITDWFVSILILVISATLVWFSLETTINDFTQGAVTSTYLAPPRWPLTGLIALGSLGLLAESVRRLLALPRRRTELSDPEHPAPAH